MQFKQMALLLFLSFVPLLAWSYLTESTNTLTVDDELNSLLMTIFLILPVLAMFAIFAKPMATALKAGSVFMGLDFEEKRVLKSGRPAVGYITNIGENSEGGIVAVNNQPYLNLKLQVYDGVSKPYAASIDTIIPRSAIPQFQPGSFIPVRADQKNPEKVFIAWDDELDMEILEKLAKKSTKR